MLDTPQLDPHQVTGAKWLASKTRAGLHDPMGLGKTATTIHALDLLGAKRGIVITTASTKENWKRELQRFGQIPRKIIKGADIYDFASWLKGYWDVLIISYGIATQWKDRIYRNIGIIDFLICDEAHAIKSPAAQRTLAIRGPLCSGHHGISQFACNVFELTGTPIPNDPTDLWAFLRFTGATKLSRSVFTEEFFFQPDETKMRFKVQPSKQAQLREMISTVSLRRDIDVVNQPLRITQTFIDGDASKVGAFLKDHPGLDATILQALEDGDLSTLGSYGEHVATVRRLIGEAKAVPFSHYLIDQLHGGLEKCVVFGVHIDALHSVRSILTRAKIPCVLINGAVSEVNRQRAIDEFQNSPACRVFIANIDTGGEGITLTAASKLYMMESGWTPKSNAQPIKRIHRRGQARPCDAEFVTLSNSFDEQIIEIVRDKVQSIFEVTNELMLAAPAAS